MSSYDQAADSAETEAQRAKGEQAYLSQEERSQVKRILAFPEEFPRELGSWVEDYMGTNGNFQKSQVQGLPLLFTQVEDAIAALATQSALLTALSQIEYEYAAAEVTTTGGYTALSGGPDISGLDDGTYLAIAIAYAGNTSAEVGASRFKIRLNGGDTGVSGVVGTSFRSDSLKDNVAIAAVVTASAGAGANTIEIQYAKTDAAGTARFEQRFLIVMRVA
jgi:hypothetical protein